MLVVICCLYTLTGPYFTPIDLASFAQQLDDAERERMAEGDTTSAEYLRYLQVLLTPNDYVFETNIFA